MSIPIAFTPFKGGRPGSPRFHASDLRFDGGAPLNVRISEGGEPPGYGDQQLALPPKSLSARAVFAVLAVALVTAFIYLK